MVRHFITLLLIAAAVLCVYGQTFRYSFHFDDYYFITENLKIRDIGRVRDIWHSLGKPSRFIGMYSFALNYHFHQTDVFGYHLVNVLIHMVNGFLVYWLGLLTLRIRSIGAERPYILAASTALLFVGHPMNTQAVTYISQRFASLATLFYLSSLCFYIQGRLAAGNRRKVSFVFFFLCAVLGMFTKQIVLTLPVCILLYEYCFLDAGKKLKIFRRPYWVILLGLFLIIPTLQSWDFSRLFDVKIESRSHAGDILTSYTYMLTQFRVIPAYIRMMFVPIGQTLDYDFPASTQFWAWPVWGGMIFIFSIIACAVMMIKRNPLIGFGILWFFLTLGIESTFIPIYQVIFEHRCYLPSIGLLFALNVFLRQSFKSRKKYLVCIMVIVTVFAWTAYKRNQVWENETTLWKDIKQKAPRKMRPYIHLGVSYIMKGDYDLALNEFNEALKISQDDYKIYHNRGIAFEMKGDLENARKDYTRSIELNPGSAPGYTNRGSLMVKLQQYNMALRDYNKAIKLNPSYADAYVGRGNLYFLAGRYEKSLNDLVRAKELGSPIEDSEINKVKQLIR